MDVLDNSNPPEDEGKPSKPSASKGIRGESKGRRLGTKKKSSKSYAKRKPSLPPRSQETKPTIPNTVPQSRPPPQTLRK